jgi:hypothetical protein
MEEEIIRFKHFKPVKGIVNDIIWVIILASSAYLLFNNIEFFAAIYLLLTICILRIIFEYTIGKGIRDLSGKFILRKDNFDIITIPIHENIYYTDIIEIRKEYYEKTVSLIGVDASQYNAGQYTVITKNNKRYKFRIAEKEEKFIAKTIRKLNKKIYGINALGVHFNLKKIKADSKENQERFEREMPKIKYSLEEAIKKLLEKSNLELNDLTK